MNAAEQKVHTRKTDQLAQVIVETQGAVVERFEEMEASFAALSTKIERLEARVASNDQHVRADIRNLNGCVSDVIRWQMKQDALTVWTRWRWLITGR